MPEVVPVGFCVAEGVGEVLIAPVGVGEAFGAGELAEAAEEAKIEVSRIKNSVNLWAERCSAFTERWLNLQTLFMIEGYFFNRL